MSWNQSAHVYKLLYIVLILIGLLLYRACDDVWYAVIFVLVVLSTVIVKHLEPEARHYEMSELNQSINQSMTNVWGEKNPQNFRWLSEWGVKEERRKRRDNINSNNTDHWIINRWEEKRNSVTQWMNKEDENDKKKKRRWRERERQH